MRQIITRTHVRWLKCYPPDHLPPTIPQPRLVTAPSGNAPYRPHPETRVPNPNAGSASRGTRGSAPFQERAPTSIYAPFAAPPPSQQETVLKLLRTVHIRQPPMRASPGSSYMPHSTSQGSAQPHCCIVLFHLHNSHVVFFNQLSRTYHILTFPACSHIPRTMHNIFATSMFSVVVIRPWMCIISCIKKSFHMDCYPKFECHRPSQHELDQYP